MKSQINELFYFETEHAHLDYDKFPEYRESLAQAELLWDSGEMPRAFFKLLDVANRISFVHGFRLGLSLVRWAGRRPKDHTP